jgi:HSP20 family protein
MENEMVRNLLTPFHRGNALRRGSADDPFILLYRDMNRLFEDVLRVSGDSEPARSGAVLLTPQMNISETDKELVVTAELPGVEEDDIEVNLDEDTLTIRGEKKVERSTDDENFHVAERMFGRFQRIMQLPFKADPDKVDAAFDNGVLTVKIPKDKGAAPSHRVQVRSARVGKNGEGEASGETRAS